MKRCQFVAVRGFLQLAIAAVALAGIVSPRTVQAQASPALSIADASTLEGNSGTKALQFAVSLSAAAATTVSVRVTTSNGTAISGSDYTGGSLTVTFAPGETLKVGNVGIRGDVVTEPDETFLVTLSSPTGGASLARAQATGTIINDDGASDTTPDAFSFAPVTNAAVGSVQTSDAITVSGINAASPISVTGGSYSINGGAFVTTAGTVTAGQTVRVQQTASSTANLTSTATLTIGGVSANYVVTTAGPSVSINDASLSEGNSGTQQATLTVSLSAASATSVTVAYATADGTATAGSDYVASSGSLTFGAGVTSQTISIGVVGDTTFEANETVLVNLSNPTAATLADGQGQITITNDDANLPTVSVNDVSVTEGNSGTVVARLTFRLSAPSTQTVSVRFATANGTATAGSDYVARTGTTTFAPGETSKTQPYTVNGDTTSEGDETFVVNLNTPVGLSIAKSQAVITIVNDDAAADTTPDAFSFAPVTNAVVGSVQTSEAITVSGINAASPISVTGGSYSINGGAFVTTAGTVTAGQTVRVQQTASSTANATSTATLTIGGVSANYVVTTAGPSVSINDASLSESNSGTQQATLTVSLSAASATSVTVGYATADGTATAGSDYVASSGSLTFGAGVTSQTVSIGILGDTTFEPDETVLVNLTSVSHATIAKGQGVVTVANDDAAPDTTPDAFSFAPVTNAALGSVQASDAITVSGINAASPIAVTGGSYSINGGAFVTTAGTVTAGQTVRVQQTASSTSNATTTATLTIGGVSAGYAVTTAGPTISINDASLSEGNSGTQQATLTVSLSAASATSVTVAYATADGTATSGSDYTALSGTLTFGAGVTSQTVSIGILGDTTFEPDETVLVNLSNPTAAALADGQGQITITNDDANLPTVSINDVSVVEGNSGTRQALLTVTLSASSTADVSVTFATSDGTASAGSDYAATSGTLTVPSGQTTGTIAVDVLGDTLFEADEMLQVTLTAPVNATLADALGTVTITNDDSAVPTFSISDASVAEGNSSSRSMVFVITLSPAATTTTSVRATTSNGTALSGSDFTGGSVSTSFAPGETSKNVSLSVRGDTTIEDDETFLVTLGSPSSGTALGRSQATGTIIDDDGDRAPDPFSFPPVTDAAAGSVETSGAITVTGINTASPISVVGGSYSINGAAFTTVAGRVTVGQSVRVQQTSSNAPSTTSITTLTIGGVAGTFSVTTAASGDTTPDAFSFAPLTDVVSGSTQTSNPVTITGIDAPAPISVTGGLYSINGGPYTGSAGTVRAGNVVTLQLIAPFTASTTGSATLTVGGVSAEFRVTTASVAADSTPDAFSFAPRADVEPGSEQTSDAITVSGINVESPISIAGGTYSINNGPFSSANALVRVGDVVAVRVTASTAFNTATQATLNIGGVQGTFTVTTKAFVADSQPDPLVFVNIFSAARAMTFTSLPVQVRGINVSVPVSIVGGTYSINGQPRTAAVGTAVNGDIIDVQLQSSPEFGTTNSLTLTVGETSASYAVETVAADQHPNPFAFQPVFGMPALTSSTSNPITVTGINTATPISVTGGAYRINGGAWTMLSGTVVLGDIVQVASALADNPVRSTGLTIGDVSASFVTFSASGLASPTPFTFASTTGFTLLGAVSESVVISGLTEPSRVQITGGQFSVNGGPFVSTTGVLRNGDSLRLLVTAGPMIDDIRTATLTVGAYSTSWSVTTQAPVDTISDQLRFPEVRSAPVNGEVISPPMPISGVNVRVPISINAPFTYSLNGGAFTGAAGTAVPGDILRVRVATGPEFGRTYSVDITIGNNTINWPVRTPGSPTRPNRFTLAVASTYTGALVLPGTVQFTQPVVVSNSTGPTAISVTNGLYSINGGPFTATAGTVNEGDSVVVRYVMPMTFSASTSVTLRIGSVSSTLSQSTVIDPVANTPTTVSGASSSFVLRTDAVVPLRAYVFNPPGWQASDRRAVYIDWAGGGWARGGLPGTRPRYWANEQGMVAISVDQRVNDRYGTFAYVHADDARLVVRWVQENAAQLGVDPSRIVVAGVSSGGGNAVWASLLEPPVTTSFRSNPLQRAAAVVLRSGVSSTADDSQLGQSQLDRFGPFARDISPESGIDNQSGKFLMFHADGDLVFAQAANLRICTLLRSMGRVCEFNNIAGLGHNWSETPGTNEQSRIQELDFLQRMGILPSVQTPAP